MSLYQNLIKDTRFLLIASASGIAILSQQLPSHALDSVFSRRAGTVIEQKSEPAHLKLANTQVRSISSASGSSVSTRDVIQIQHQQSVSADDRVKSLYGSKKTATPQPLRPVVAKPIQRKQAAQQQSTSVPQQAVQPQRRSQISQTAGTQGGRRSFFDRLVGKVRGDRNIPSGPPQDPGMRYTTVSQAAQQKQRVAQQEPKRFVPPPVPGVSLPTATSTAQSAGKFIPPPVPGISASEPTQTAVVSTPVSESVKPRLFPTSKDANPIDHPLAMPKRPSLAPPAGFLPPAPDAEGFRAPPLSQPSVAKATDSQSESRHSFPGLKAILEGTVGDAPKVAAAPVPAPTSAVDSPEWKKTTKGKEAAIVTTLIVPKPASATSEKVEFGKKLPNMELELNSASSAQKSQTLTRNVVAVPSINELEIPPSAELQTPMLAPATVPAETKVVADFDPLANPFPADVEQVVESEKDSLDLVFEKPAMEETQSEEPSTALDENVANLTAPAFPTNKMVQETEQNQAAEEPYTGLALEQNLFMNTQVPAPAEPQAEAISAEPKVASQELVTTEAESLPQLPLLPLPEVKTEPKPEEMKTPSLEIPQVAEADVPEEEPGRSTLERSEQTPQLQAPEVSLKEATLPKTKETKQSKMELISARKDLTGLKGFCSVSLRDSRDLIDVRDDFTAIFNGKEYSFSSAEALEKFTENPGKYAPAIRGSDVIHLSLTGEEVEGSLDNAVWYKGRLYLFTTVETMETFVAAPSSHATDL